MRTFAAAVLLVALLPVAAWAANCTASTPTLCLSLNQASPFQAGQTLNLSASVTPGTTPPSVDVYVALQLPTGTLLFLQGDGSFNTALAPILSGWTPSAFSGQIFNYLFSGGEPSGAYHWLAAFAQPGTLNFIGGIADTPFAANLSGTYGTTGNLTIGGCLNAIYPITGDLTITQTGADFMGVADLSAPTAALSLILNLTGTVDGTSVSGSYTGTLNSTPIPPGIFSATIANSALASSTSGSVPGTTCTYNISWSATRQ